jgi:5-formyltetrahydrofolate cyclo-ligase
MAADDPNPHPDALPAWRSARRAALIRAREALPADVLLAARLAIDNHLQRGFADLARGPIAFCWPYRQEYDARHLLARLRRQGAVTLLPVVVGKGRPMIFRAWKPGDAMLRGGLGIPYPADGADATPDTVLLPVVGFDDDGYRLGYGGGFFDRTLQALQERGARPRVIGVGHELARLPTIHPQAYDRPLDYMVTERGIYARRDGRFAFCD